MSGKAPPRGPRALLGSQSAGLSSPASTSTNSQPASSAPTSPVKKAPPTGPRSLTNGMYSAVPIGPSRGVKPKPMVNGHVSVPVAGPSTIAAPAKSPPTGPSALLGRLSDKGKHVERSPAVTKPQLNGTTATLASTPEQLPPAPIKFSFPAKRTSGIAPPQPASEPPPPPPPSHPPPPPPPPSSAPPPIPPPAPPSTSPPPPPPAEPAPPPPPTSVPHPPPSDPPPLPPTKATTKPHLPPSVPPPLPVAEPAQPVSAQPPQSPTKPASPPPPQTYSLPPLPPWPPERSEYALGKNFKVLYDPVLDKDRDGRLKSLLEKVRVAPSSTSAVTDPRIKGKGKGKEILYRYEGEVVDGEPDIFIRDPRKAYGFKAPKSQRPARNDFHELKYEYDSNSTGPPPPTSVLITNISPLTPNQQIRRHFGTHGPIQSFEAQIDKENGGALGIVFIKFNTHEEAKRCVEKENGKRLGIGGGIGLSVGAGEGEEVRVVFDGEGLKLKAVMKELDDGRRRVREEKKRKEREAKIKEANAAAGTPPTNTSAGQTPQQPGWWPPGQHPHGGAPHLPHILNNRPAHLPQHPGTHFNNSQPPNAPPPRMVNGVPAASLPVRVRRPPAALVQARISNASSMSNAYLRRYPVPPNPSLHSHSSSSTPLRSHPLPNHLSRLNPHTQASPLTAPSRSPSPISRRPGQSSQSAKQKEHEAVNEALSKNGFDHAKIDGTDVGGSVTEEDIKVFFEGFKIDKVLQDYLGWYVTFQTNDTARRAAMFLNSGARTLARHSVTISVHPAPSMSALSFSASGKVRWDDDELIDQAEQITVRELKAALEKDLTERLVGSQLRKMVAQEKVRKVEERAKASGRDAESGEHRAEKRGLKGLSFKKPNKRVREEVQVVVETEADAETVGPEEDEELGEETVEAVERPKKRRKKDIPKKTKKVIEEDDIESEDDDTLVTESTEVARKRTSSEDRGEDEPIKKRVKTAQADDEAKVRSKKTLTKKKPAKKQRPAKVKEIVEEVVLPTDMDFNVPDVVHFPGFDSSLSPSPPPVPAPKVPRLPTPPPDPLDEGICKDDEDLYFSRLVLSGAADAQTSLIAPLALDADNLPPFRTHVTGSARTEGYYKISHAEKSAYVAQYALRVTATEQAAPVEAPQPQHITSSRSNRANARRAALGLEEINQVQRAVALSKGETAAEMTIKFNQLQTRKKHLRFARSPIHDWGLYAMERISRGEMVIEYVGEVIRAQVADKREKAYERQGIGSSYLFRIDEDLVVDATKKGNLGRLINHACDPNCTAKIITINGEKKIVIYAKRDIELGDEITYDYHFPIEQDKIPCLCGSVKCRGYLN